MLMCCITASLERWRSVDYEYFLSTPPTLVSCAGCGRKDGQLLPATRSDALEAASGAQARTRETASRSRKQRPVR